MNEPASTHNVSNEQSQLAEQMAFFADLIDESRWQNVPDPVFILAGSIPDYSHRLPPGYHICTHLGKHLGMDFILYSPRAFEIQDGTLTLIEGTLDSEEGECEFEVKISLGEIKQSYFFNRAGYEGKELHTLVE